MKCFDFNIWHTVLGRELYQKKVIIIMKVDADDDDEIFLEYKNGNQTIAVH